MAVRSISPRINTTKKKLEIVLVEPMTGDWIMIGLIMIVSIPLAYYTTPNWTYCLICIAFYWLLAFTLIEDTFEVVIDLAKNSVQVKKSKLGKTLQIRASLADELVNVEVVECPYGKNTGHRLELEFMSDFGYYRLQASETLLLGEQNRAILESVAGKIRKFKNLKPLPDWMKEENLAKVMPTSLTKEQRDQLRKMAK